MENTQNRVWLTVDEAFLNCIDQGLNRTKKTIRQWCRQDHVDGQKRSTPNGEAWMIEKSSLQIKIQSELEFVQSRANPHEQQTTKPQQQGNEELRDTIRSLEIDKGIRDAQIKYLEVENEKGKESLSAQARYIGHLETLAQLAGASPDAKFLSSPVPHSEIGTNTPFQNNNTLERKMYDPSIQQDGSISNRSDVDSNAN